MSLLVNSNTVTIVAGETTTEFVGIHVLPLASSVEGKGRMIHPTLGTLDYPYAPDKWTNVDTDLIIPPVWASTQTLGGGANTLWAGNIKDVVVTESWTEQLTMPVAFLRVLINYWMNPPAPEDDFLEWYPTYANSFGYKVIITSITSGGKEITLNGLTRQGWVSDGVEMTLKVAGRVV